MPQHTINPDRGKEEREEECGCDEYSLENLKEVADRCTLQKPILDRISSVLAGFSCFDKSSDGRHNQHPPKRSHVNPCALQERTHEKRNSVLKRDARKRREKNVDVRDVTVVTEGGGGGGAPSSFNGRHRRHPFPKNREETQAQEAQGGWRRRGVGFDVRTDTHVMHTTHMIHAIQTSSDRRKPIEKSKDAVMISLLNVLTSSSYSRLLLKAVDHLRSEEEAMADSLAKYDRYREHDDDGGPWLRVIDLVLEKCCTMDAVFVDMYVRFLVDLIKAKAEDDVTEAERMMRRVNAFVVHFKDESLKSVGSVLIKHDPRRDAREQIQAEINEYQNVKRVMGSNRTLARLFIAYNDMQMLRLYASKLLIEIQGCREDRHLYVLLDMLYELVLKLRDHSLDSKHIIHDCVQKLNGSDLIRYDALTPRCRFRLMSIREATEKKSKKQL